VLGKYLEDRGPHLAAMVAYYALLSLFPFIFLSMSVLGLFGQISESSYLIRELERILPNQSVDDLTSLVHSVQRNAQTFFLIGIVGMMWSALGFYSALESALNIVFRVSNRGFVRGKWLSFLFVLASLVVLFLSLAVATFAIGWLDRHAPGVLHSGVVPYVISLLLSAVGSFLFLMTVFRVLTNVELHRGDVWPGALFGTVLFEISFQAVPFYLHFADVLVALRAFGGIVLVLVWLYLMANIIVLGAEVNWRHWIRHQPAEQDLEAGGVHAVAHQTVGQRSRRRVQRAGAWHPEVGPARPSSVLHQDRRAHVVHLDGHRSVEAVASWNLTRVPGVSSAGCGRRTSHRTTSVRPRSRQPPGDSVGYTPHHRPARATAPAGTRVRGDSSRGTSTSSPLR